MHPTVSSHDITTGECNIITQPDVLGNDQLTSSKDIKKVKTTFGRQGQG